MIGRLLTRGPAAARRPALNESGRPRADRNRRSRSLFARKLSTSSSQPPSTESQSSSGLFKTIDLEGIANDGFGYTVSITAAPAEPRSTRWKRWKFNRERRESSSSPETVRRSISVPRTVASYLRDDKDIEKGGEMSEAPGIQVMTSNSFDVRTSYHEPDERGWDVRNPYKHRPQEGDIKIGIERSTSRLGERAAADDALAKELALPNVPEDGANICYRPNTSPTMQNQPRGLDATAGSRSGSRTSGELHRRPSTGGRAKSPTFPYRPSTMESALRRANSPTLPMLQQPQSALLAPGRMARAVSPVVQPLNSSQWWANAPRPTSRSTAQTLRSGRTVQTSHTARSQPGEAWPLPVPLDAVVDDHIWDEVHPVSFRSSVAARDGSRESLVIGEDSRNPPNIEEEEIPGSPTSITLPIDGPFMSKNNNE
jgi:hypothetical protein